MYENNNPNSDSESSTYRYTPERGTQSIYTGSSQSGQYSCTYTRSPWHNGAIAGPTSFG